MSICWDVISNYPSPGTYCAWNMPTTTCPTANSRDQPAWKVGRSIRQWTKSSLWHPPAKLFCSILTPRFVSSSLIEGTLCWSFFVLTVPDVALPSKKTPGSSLEFQTDRYVMTLSLMKRKVRYMRANKTKPAVKACSISMTGLGFIYMKKWQLFSLFYRMHLYKMKTH